MSEYNYIFAWHFLYFYSESNDCEFLGKKVLSWCGCENPLSNFLPAWSWKSVISGMSGSALSLSVHLQCAKQVTHCSQCDYGTLTEHKLKLVTNLTQLKPVSSMTQQGLVLWFVAVMLSLPTGNIKGHKGRRRPLPETAAEPNTQPWALWGGRTRAQ